MKASARWILLCVLFTGLIVAGCHAARANDSGPALSFETQMQINSKQEFHVSLGVQNKGPAPFAGDEMFYGQMELRYADGDRAGDMRASAEIVTLSPVAPGETAWPMAWRAQLDPGTYSLTWGAEGYGVTTVDFQVVERDGRLDLAS
jgi:hypothetical protein